MTLKQKLQQLYRENQILFIWQWNKYDRENEWECTGEQITDRALDELVNWYLANDSDFYTVGIREIDEDRLKACLEDDDDEGLWLLRRDALRAKAREWASESADWDDLRYQDLQSERAA